MRVGSLWQLATSMNKNGLSYTRQMTAVVADRVQEYKIKKRSCSPRVAGFTGNLVILVNVVASPRSSGVNSELKSRYVKV